MVVGGGCVERLACAGVLVEEQGPTFVFVQFARCTILRKKCKSPKFNATAADHRPQPRSRSPHLSIPFLPFVSILCPSSPYRIVVAPSFPPPPTQCVTFVSHALPSPPSSLRRPLPPSQPCDTPSPIAVPPSSPHPFSPPPPPEPVVAMHPPSVPPRPMRTIPMATSPRAPHRRRHRPSRPIYAMK